ncbi:hypothetical protein [Kitasatospora sp. NPDC057015]|uniref:hypothetical protein n=1 Tax=Kitasatospora sp. NPDC057015 TaxID=3346001 RepID=UPI00363BBB4B
MAPSGEAPKPSTTARGPKTTASDGMKSVRGTFVYPEDLTPGNAGKAPGGLHQNLYNENGKLEGHGTFFPDDANEPGSPEPETVFVFVTSETAPPPSETDIDELLDTVLRLLSFSVEHAPQFIQWWKTRALPVVKSGWKKAARTGVPGIRRVGDRAPSPATTADAPRMASAPVGGRSSARMSTAEAQARLVLAQLAKAFSDEQAQIVRDARIDDADEGVEQGRVVHAPTPGQIADVTRTLQCLDAATLAEVRKLLESTGTGRSMLALGPS